MINAETKDFLMIGSRDGLMNWQIFFDFSAKISIGFISSQDFTVFMTKPFLRWLSHLFGKTDTCLLSSRPGGSTKVSRYDLLKLQGDNLGFTRTRTICKPQQILRKFANQQPITVSAKWVIN